MKCRDCEVYPDYTLTCDLHPAPGPYAHEAARQSVERLDQADLSWLIAEIDADEIMEMFSPVLRVDP